jgi:hypothetical protein
MLPKTNFPNRYLHGLLCKIVKTKICEWDFLVALPRGAFEKNLIFIFYSLPGHGRRQERCPASTPAAGTRCWPERQSWHRRAAARIRDPLLSLFLPPLPLGRRLQPLLHCLVPLAVKLCFISVDSGQGDQAELDWRRGGALGLGGCHLGARFGCNRARKDHDFVVVRGSTVTSSCDCRDLRRLELPASTAACLEVYAAAEGQHPLGGSASSSGGSCGGGAGRPGYPAASLA